MSFFEKFQRTVFVKDDSELEEKLNSLKAIRDKVVEKDEIEKEIKISELGLIGEKRIEYELKCANIGMYVLHDVNVVVDELTAQVDWVVITPAYCYLIECKNLIGNVTVNSQGEFRRYYQYKGKKIAEAIYSPYRQAVRHKEIWKKDWCTRRGKIKIFLENDIFENWYKPLVVFANPNGILDIKYAPAEIKRSIVKVDNLIEYFKADIMRKGTSELDGRKNMEENAIGILKKINKKVRKDYTKQYTLIQENSDKEQNIGAGGEAKCVESTVVENKKVENKTGERQAYERKTVKGEEVESKGFKDKAFEGRNVGEKVVEIKENEGEAVENRVIENMAAETKETDDKALHNKTDEKDNDSIQKELREELLKFRKEKSRNMNVPAYYVFTNDEMNKIIEEKPKTIEELRKNNILSQIKIKCHGKEIVKIVGECIEKNGKSPA